MTEKNKWADFEEFQAIYELGKGRLTPPEFALFEAYLSKQANRLIDTKLSLTNEREDHEKTYGHLQDIADVRDVLLTYLYQVLERPNGILIKDMTDAIRDLLADTARLRANNADMNESLKRVAAARAKDQAAAVPFRLQAENDRLRADALHDHKTISALYAELSDLYNRKEV